jgi:hypothetical protein
VSKESSFFWTQYQSDPTCLEGYAMNLNTRDCILLCLINLQAIQFADVQVQGSWYFSVAQMASQTLGRGSSMSLTNFFVIENRTGYSSPWEKVKQFPIYSSWQVLKRSNRRNTRVRKPFV